MSGQTSSVVLYTDLGLVKELEDREFRNQYFRAEREIDIPAQIKALRKFRRMKQGELAKHTGMFQSAISRLERSQDAKFELETLVKIAEALDARLTVTFEPYETVIARYRAETKAEQRSAALDMAKTSNQPPSSLAAKADSETRQEYGIGSYREHPDRIPDPTPPPERATVPA